MWLSQDQKFDLLTAVAVRRLTCLSCFLSGKQADGAVENNQNKGNIFTFFIYISYLIYILILLIIFTDSVI